jgi:RNA polymerase sigma factor (TIGR02999 family)
MAEAPGEVSRLLAELNNGNKDALGSLMPLVYQELRRVAGGYLRGERAGHTLQPTALVHEAYLRLVGQDKADWRNRGQFMAVAAQLMRRILVDYARARATRKRAGEAVHVDMDLILPIDGNFGFEEILVVDDLLEQLAGLDAQQASVVEMRYFAGMTVEETAAALGISERTVKRDWSMAAAWLRSELAGRNHQ